MWPRGFPSTRTAPSLPTHAHLSWPLPAAGPELYILFYWISWLLSPDLMLSEQWWRQLGGLWQRTWIWSPGLRSWLCHLQARCFPMSFSFLGLYFLVPKWANDLAGKLGGLRWGAAWKVLLERKRQWLLQLANVHGEVRHLYHLRLQSVTGNRDSRTQVPWI